MTYSYGLASTVQVLSHAFLKTAQSVYGGKKSFVAPHNFFIIATRSVLTEGSTDAQPYVALRSSEGNYSIFKRDHVKDGFFHSMAYLPLASALQMLEKLESESIIDNKSAIPANHYSKVKALLGDWPEREYFSNDAAGDQGHSAALRAYHRRFCPQIPS